MKKMQILAICLAALMVLSIAPLSFAQKSEPTKNPVGMNISGFSAEDLYGNPVDGSILAEYELTFMNFWATWCGPCTSEMPYIQQFFEEYESQGINVLGLLCEGNGCTPASARAFCEQNGYTYPTIVPDSVLNSLINNSGGYIPVSYVIDSAGTIRDYHVGSMSYAQIVSFVTAWLDEEPVTPAPPTEPPAGLIYGTSFETAAEAAEWTMLDEDGDGRNWMWSGDVDGMFNCYDGSGIMASESYVNDVGPLTPDNWLISPAITLPADASNALVSFYYSGQDPSWSAEKFGVYVSTDGGNTWSDELGFFTASGSYQNGTVALGDYAGQEINIAFRHYNVTDMFVLNLDLVEVFSGNDDQPIDPPTTEPPTSEPPVTNPPEGYATVILRADDVWGDGTGYQLLLDADANTYGTVVPVVGAEAGYLTITNYNDFEYTVPEGAEANLNTDTIVVGDSVSITVPSGVYDWAITNPTPGSYLWLVSNGRGDDMVLEPDMTYEFYVHASGEGDAVTVTETQGSEPTTEPPTTEPPTTEPPTTEPPTTEPPVTEPPTTEPPVEYDMGDVNMDGTVNTGDAALVLRSAVGLDELTQEQLVLADFNNDGKVDTGDSAAILRFAVGL